ncbi:MAG: iron-sulfur cluster assembly scaffold protein [Acidobacteriota bacterium]|nr:iron-sulfur cluster assembly scaffold protein [Acidobacteriota bacterium]
MYSAALLDHFEHPRNAGEIGAPNAAAQLENPVCGDILKLSLRLDRARITEAKFLAKGCVAAIACGSAITELLLGKTAVEASRITREELVAAVGGLPATSTHASHLALATLRAALAQIPE